MTPMSRAKLSILTLLALAATSASPAAQSAAPRLRQELLRGQALQLDGSPWPKATVHAWGRLHASGGPLFAPLRLELETDEQGRFHAKVPRAYHWWIWASAPKSEQRLRIAAPKNALSGDLRIQLIEEPRTVPTSLRVRFPPKIRGVQVASALLDFDFFEFPVPLDDEHKATLEAYPSPQARLWLLDASGQRIANGVAGETWTFAEFLAAEKKKVDLEDTPRELGDARRVYDFELHHLDYAVAQVQVLGHPSSKPIAGARVTAIEGLDQSYSSTDEQGIARLHVPLYALDEGPSLPPTIELHVEAPGHVAGTVLLRCDSQAWIRKQVRPGDPVEATARPDRDPRWEVLRHWQRRQEAQQLERAGRLKELVPLELARQSPPVQIRVSEAASIRGRLMWNEQEPAAHVPLRVFREPNRLPMKGSHLSLGPRKWPRLVHTDARGHFEIDTLAMGQNYALFAILDPAQLAAVSQRRGYAIEREACIRIAKAPAKPHPEELGAIRLDLVEGVLLQGINKDGSPLHLRRVCLQLLTDDPGTLMTFFELRPLRGRTLALLSPKQARWKIRATDGYRYFQDVLGGKVLDSPEAPGREGPWRKLQFEMMDPFWIEGCVRGPDGEPIEGAVVETFRTSGSRYQALSYLQVSEGRSNAQGQFRLPVLPDGSYSVTAAYPELRYRDARGRHQARLSFDVKGSSPAPVTLRLPRKSGGKR
jgi:hypothetical protein